MSRFNKILMTILLFIIFISLLVYYLDIFSFKEGWGRRRRWRFRRPRFRRPRFGSVTRFASRVGSKVGGVVGGMVSGVVGGVVGPPKPFKINQAEVIRKAGGITEASELARLKKGYKGDLQGATYKKQPDYEKAPNIEINFDATSHFQKQREKIINDHLNSAWSNRP